MSDVDLAVWCIRLAAALVMIAFGVHQIIRPMAWRAFMPELVTRRMFVPTGLALQVHGVGNVFLGLLFAIGFWPMVFDWIIVAWWLSIIPMAFRVDWTIGLRDSAVLGAIVAVIILTH